MRFITEFELKFPYQLSIAETYKTRSNLDLGNQIADNFEWQEEFDDDKNNFKLEIEAFPMDKWIEFKRDLFAFLDLNSLQYKTLLDRVSELESYGKPAGAAKEL